MVATVVIVVVTGVMAHEVAHALAARVVGHHVFAIDIGVGPHLRRRVGGMDVSLGALPLGGSVLSGSPDAAGYRWRAAVVAAAGPVTNLALAGLCAVAGIGVGVVFNLVAAAGNLWPGGRRHVGVAASDGRVLLDLVRGSADAVAEERSTWWVAHALEARREGRLAEADRLVAEGRAEVGETPSLLIVEALIAVEDRRFVDAVDAYAALIDDRRLSVAARAGVAADAAWAAGLSDDPALRALALPWAALARRVQPRDARRRVVHGLALVDAGQPVAARAAVRGVTGPSAGAVEVLALLALGETESAFDHFAERVERSLEPGHPLRDRVESALHGR